MASESVNIGAVDGEAGDDFAQRIAEVFEREVARPAVQFGNVVQAAGEHVQFARQRHLQDQPLAIVDQVVHRLFHSGKGLVEALEGAGMPAIDEDAVQVIQEAVAGGAVDGPRPQLFVSGQDLFGDDVERTVAAGGLLELLEVARRVIQAVGVIDTQALDPAALDQLADAGVDKLEDLRIFDTDGGQFVDVVEAAVVDFVGGDAPVRDAVGLIVEQAVERVEARRIAERRRRCARSIRRWLWRRRRTKTPAR